MLMGTESAHDSVTAPVRRRSWPYRLAVASVVLGAIGLVVAPFGGAAYLALPGAALGTWFAFLDESPFRVAFALSLTAFVLGLLTGLVGLYVSAAGSGSFALQESGFLVVAAALWLLPLAGLVFAAFALVGAHFRPGVVDSALHRDDLEPV